MRRSWTPRRAIAIASGGVLGAALRWVVVTSVDAGRFPWPILGVNVAGSIVLGALLAEEWARPSARLLLHDFGGIGFCGGLTTFSTFALEVVELQRSGHGSTAAIYAATSVVTALVGAWRAPAASAASERSVSPWSNSRDQRARFWDRGREGGARARGSWTPVEP